MAVQKRLLLLIITRAFGPQNPMNKGPITRLGNFTAYQSTLNDSPTDDHEVRIYLKAAQTKVNILEIGED